MIKLTKKCLLEKNVLREIRRYKSMEGKRIVQLGHPDAREISRPGSPDSSKPLRTFLSSQEHRAEIDKYSTATDEEEYLSISARCSWQRLINILLQLMKK